MVTPQKQIQSRRAERVVLGCGSAAGIADNLWAQPQLKLKTAVSKGAFCFLPAAQFKQLFSAEEGW